MSLIMIFLRDSDVVILPVFCFNDTSLTEIYTYCHTLALHDALPIYTVSPIPPATPAATAPCRQAVRRVAAAAAPWARPAAGSSVPAPPHRHRAAQPHRDRKSTRLNSSL